MRKPTTEIVIIIMLWISIIISIIRNPSFCPQFIFGILSAMTVSTALLLEKKDLSLGMLTFALILSVFNAVKFSEAFSLSMGFVQLIPLILLIILIFIKLRELIDLKKKWFDAESTEVRKTQENKISFFNVNFKTFLQKN
ncbi:hypothetical protein [Flavobacterium aestuarii]|uniref:hypothetical protein n=1 Tax=Flavobacterium aestuarii TaxID=3149227 RepID=UPI0032B3A344